MALESLIAPFSSKSRPMDLGKAVGDTSHAAPLTESAMHAFTASGSPKVYLRCGITIGSQLKLLVWTCIGQRWLKAWS